MYVPGHHIGLFIERVNHLAGVVPVGDGISMDRSDIFNTVKLVDGEIEVDVDDSHTFISLG
jgi:hypothetical protein